MLSKLDTIIMSNQYISDYTLQLLDVLNQFVFALWQPYSEQIGGVQEETLTQATTANEHLLRIRENTGVINDTLVDVHDPLLHAIQTVPLPVR